MVVDRTRAEIGSGDGLPSFARVGDVIGGEYHCAACGYGIAIRRSRLPRCPMCGGSTWEHAATSPFPRRAPS